MEKMKYGRAVKKLDEIIQKIENEDIDVDELSAHVKEAVGLVHFCKEKIEKAQMEVRQVVEGFEQEFEKDDGD